MHAPALRPDRLRRVEPPFGWIPFRILTSGLLQQLGPPTKLLYFFLCLVADGRGISFYGDRRLQDLLALSSDELDHARAELCQRDLLAFDGRVYQLLSLPAQANGGGAGRRSAPVPPGEASVAQRVGGRARVVHRSGAPKTRMSPEPLREILRRLDSPGAAHGESESRRRSRRWL